MERSSRVLHHRNPKICFIFLQKSSKFEFWLSTKSWNHHSFVNISLTLVIDISMERSSRVLHYRNPKIWIFFQKSSKFEFWLSTNSWNHHSFVNIRPTLVIDTSMERPSRVLHHGNPKICIFFQKFEIRFWLSTMSWNHHIFVNISPTLVIDTSTERSSSTTTTWEPKIWFFFQKSSKLNSTCAKELKSTFKYLGLTYMSTSGMHRRPFEGRHLVVFNFLFIYLFIFFWGTLFSRKLYLKNFNIPFFHEMMDWLADIMTFGVPLPCPQCNDKKIRFKSGKGYACGGFISEYTACTFVDRAPKRQPFNIPEELAAEYSFLWVHSLCVKGQPELTDPFNLLINVKLRMLWNWKNFFLFKRTFLW